MFKTVKAFTKSSTWNTSVNGKLSDADIKSYFVNTVFDVGVYPIEKMEKCYKIEINNKAV